MTRKIKPLAQLRPIKNQVYNRKPAFFTAHHVKIMKCIDTVAIFHDVTSMFRTASGYPFRHTAPRCQVMLN
jgi:hypothetical protein